MSIQYLEHALTELQSMIADTDMSFAEVEMDVDECDFGVAAGDEEVRLLEFKIAQLLEEVRVRKAAASGLMDHRCKRAQDGKKHQERFRTLMREVIKTSFALLDAYKTQEAESHAMARSVQDDANDGSRQQQTVNEAAPVAGRLPELDAGQQAHDGQHSATASTGQEVERPGPPKTPTLYEVNGNGGKRAHSDTPPSGLQPLGRPAAKQARSSEATGHRRATSGDIPNEALDHTGNNEKTAATPAPSSQRSAATVTAGDTRVNTLPQPVRRGARTVGRASSVRLMKPIEPSTAGRVPGRAQPRLGGRGSGLPVRRQCLLGPVRPSVKPPFWRPGGKSTY
ncbi:hypothetical protein LTR65_007668 [Meristemomyces frigidus]